MVGLGLVMRTHTHTHKQAYRVRVALWVVKGGFRMGGIRLGFGSRTKKPRKRAKPAKSCTNQLVGLTWVRVGLGLV